LNFLVRPGWIGYQGRADTPQMSVPRTSFPRLALSGLLLGGLASPLGAQEFIPVEETRIERGSADAEYEAELRPDEFMDVSGFRGPRRAALPEGTVGEGLDLGFIASAEYESNIFLSDRDEVGDVVMRFSPEIAYAQGREDQEGAYLRVAYRPTAVVYADNGEEDRLDHDLALAVGFRGRKSAILYRGRLLRLGDATADVGALTERFEYANELRVAWLPREKVAVELAAALEGTEYDNGQLADTRDAYGEVALRYAYSPKTEVSAAYRIGRVEVEGSPDQTFQQVTARLAWRPRAKIAIDVEAGFEHRDYDPGSDVFPVFRGGIAWQPREGTTLYLDGYRRQEASAFFAGQNYDLTGVTAGVSQRLNRCWVVRLEGGYERADYRQVSGPGLGGRDDETWFIRPRADYEVAENLALGFFYQYSENRSNGPGFGYANHQLGVEMDYQF